MEKQPQVNVPKLKRAIIENTGPVGSGKPFTRRSLSNAASGHSNPDMVRDILRGQDKNISLKTAAGIADALGIDVAEFIVGGTFGSKDRERITVVGEVQAGVWREQTMWPEEDRYGVEVLPLEFAAERFGLRVVGFSMDLEFAPGTVLDCIRVGFDIPGPAPRHGDLVIVQRQQGDLCETTCKRLEIVDGDHWLRPLSTRPEFQEPIFLGKPDADDHSDNDVRIIGIVNASVKQHYQPTKPARINPHKNMQPTPSTTRKKAG